MTADRRIDALTGVEVIIASHRQQRPNLPATGCPFCVGGLESPDPYDVRSFTNRWPTLGDGRAEVILFSPDHDQSLGGLGPHGVRSVIDLWAQRTEALGSRDDVKYVLVFENRGADVGATISHPHGQLYAFDHVPPVPANELRIAEERGSCAICGEQPDDRLVVDVGSGADQWRGWIPLASAHPFGLTIAPADHVPDLVSLSESGRDAMATALSDILIRLDRYFDEATPYMLWLHQRPTDGGTWPLAHLHVEVVPFRRAKGVNRYVAAAELGSGTFINSVSPVDAARSLRATNGMMGP